MTELHGGTDRIALGPDIYVQAPGLVGSVELAERAVLGTRSGEEAATPTLVAALDRQDFAVLHSLEIAATPVVGVGPQANRGTDDRPLLSLEVPGVGAPGPTPDQIQVALLADEEGIVSWHYPQPGSMPNLVRFDVPADTVAVQELAPSDGTRGLVSIIGKKLLSVLVFPLIEAGAEYIGQKIAEWWENNNRPSGVRRFIGPADGTALTPIDGHGWSRLAEGRALLFVHGTFSSSHGGFGALDESAWGTLSSRYGSRVFSFDHPSLSVDPHANASTLLSFVPPGIQLDVDVVTHSRGGLVARALACAAPIDSSPIRVGMIIHVGAPNAGTALADVESHAKFVDRMSTLLNLAPDGPLSTVADILDGVLTVVKIIGCNAVGALPGLSAMDPRKDWLPELGQRQAQPYTGYAIGSDYEPKGGLLKLMRGADGVADRVFGMLPNDVVVPSHGVYEAAGAAGFPVPAERRIGFDRHESIWHCAYFGQSRTSDALLNWLGG